MPEEFTVKIDCGDVYINEEFVSQLNWNAESVGYSIARWLVEHGYPTCDPDSYENDEDDEENNND